MSSETNLTVRERNLIKDVRVHSVDADAADLVNIIDRLDAELSKARTMGEAPHRILKHLHTLHYNWVKNFDGNLGPQCPPDRNAKPQTEVEREIDRMICEIFEAYHARIQAVGAELSELKAKLPKTADGVSVVPGMMLWHVIGDGPVPSKVFDWSTVNALSEDMEHGFVFYSTREAAQQAAKEGE